MVNFIIFILSTLGLTFIINHSYIIKPIKEKIKNKTITKLLNCSQCLGFWVALIIQFIILLHTQGIFYWSDIYYVTYGFIGSFVCYFTYLLIKPLMDKYD